MTHCWPEFKSYLSALNNQVAAVGGEIIVTDSSGNDLRQECQSVHQTVRGISMPGTPVFVLRRNAIKAARGSVIGSIDNGPVAGFSDH